MSVAKKKGKGHVGFEALKAQLAGRPDVVSPGGLAAWIGRQKYGKPAFQRAAAAGRPMGHNPRVLVHYLTQALFKRTRKQSSRLAQIDADRTGLPVAIVDERAGRVLKFVRPRKGARQNPRAALGHYRIRRQGGRQVLEVYRA